MKNIYPRYRIQQFLYLIVEMVFLYLFTGELFAQCPVESYPGIAVESVTDSSRYFVLRIRDDNGKTEDFKF